MTKNTNTFALAFSLFLLLITTSPVLAEDRERTLSLTPRPRQELRQDIKETKTSALIQLRHRAFDKIYQKMLSDFDHQLDILTKYRNRIQTRIDKKKSEGKNVDAAQAKLNEFNPSSATSTYQIDLSAFKAKVEELKTAPKPLSVISDLRQAGKKVRQDLQDLRQLLVEALRLTVKSK